ncbi:hypothetical protein ADK86_11700 [Streptomyces sp. NRRL F-5755]|uniref:hypothetical protein n=1 Tax=Streptomyces sp. NRRL F-5755 TaxID=1519475 RepID=UPI0006B032F2|nr:hypothetical protein [Streptomyces sp. NRRL F-5755]KOU01810.1 hypothetical protein ADK86_11700 [Streptomyces sp. NRRL F-5755]
MPHPYHLTPRHRARLALSSVLPTLLTVPLCAALAIAGVLPWSIAPTVAVALAIQAAVAYVRPDPGLTGRPSNGSAPPR